MTRGTYVVFEGGDGLGKTFFTDAIRDCFPSEEGRQIFDVNAFWKKNRNDPTAFLGISALYLSEPSYAAEGLCIRDYLIAEPPKGYAEPPVRYIAEAFARDRTRIFELLIRPALDNGIHVISSRNFLSSFAYQPIQAELRRPREYLSEDDLLRIPGNRLAVTDFRPDLVVICVAEEATRRLRMSGRSEEEDDNATTERIDISERVAQYYRQRAPLVCDTFGIPNELLSLDGTKEDSLRLAREYYQRLFT